MAMRVHVPAAGVSLAIVACLASASASAAQQSPPGAKWLVSGEGIRCTLSRLVQESGPKATIGFRSYPGQGWSEFMLIVDPFHRGVGPAEKLTLTLAPGGQTQTRPAVAIPMEKGGGTALSASYLPGEFLDAYAKAETITVSVGGKAVGTFPVPHAAGAAVEAFNMCKAEKLVEWGADPAGFEAGGRQISPVGDPRQWVTYKDLHLTLPLGPNNFGGVAVARLGVAPDGTVDKCDLIYSNHNPVLEATACRTLLKRARFEPAKAADGHPVRSVATFPIDMTVTETVEMFGIWN